jgi:hypothetical protein
MIDDFGSYMARRAQEPAIAGARATIAAEEAAGCQAAIFLAWVIILSSRRTNACMTVFVIVGNEDEAGRVLSARETRGIRAHCK